MAVVRLPDLRIWARGPDTRQRSRWQGLSQCIAVYCSVLQCSVVFCSVLQCVSVCCSALQCVAVDTMLRFELDDTVI